MRYILFGTIKSYPREVKDLRPGLLRNIHVKPTCVNNVFEPGFWLAGNTIARLFNSTWYKFLFKWTRKNKSWIWIKTWKKVLSLKNRLQNGGYFFMLLCAKWHSGNKLWKYICHLTHVSWGQQSPLPSWSSNLTVTIIIANGQWLDSMSSFVGSTNGVT